MSTEQDLNEAHGGGSGLNVELDVDDLALLVRRLANALAKAAPDNDLPKKALDYLHRCELKSALMREQEGQIAESFGVDFETNLWTFKMQDGFRTGAGNYRITKMTPNAKVRGAHDGLEK